MSRTWTEEQKKKWGEDMAVRRELKKKERIKNGEPEPKVTGRPKKTTAYIAPEENIKVDKPSDKLISSGKITEQHLLQDKAFALRSLGKTQVEIAEILGCSQRHVGNLCAAFEKRAGVGILNQLSALNLYRQNLLRAMTAYEASISMSKKNMSAQVPKLITSMTDIIDHMSEVSGLKVSKKLVLQKTETYTNKENQQNVSVLKRFIAGDLSKLGNANDNIIDVEEEKTEGVEDARDKE